MFKMNINHISFYSLFSIFLVISLLSFLPSFAISQKQTSFGIQMIDWICDNLILKLFTCNSKNEGTDDILNNTSQQPQKPSESMPNSTNPPTQLSSTQIYNNVRDSVVTVRSEVNGHEGQGISSGSGFIWDKNGYIVTDRHVIEGAIDIVVQFDRDTNHNYPAHVIGSDALSDLAVLEVDNAPSFDLSHPVQLRTEYDL
jgi:S1-C subfamily serine protease